jgi:hypothetical protein
MKQRVPDDVESRRSVTGIRATESGIEYGTQFRYI